MVIVISHAWTKDEAAHADSYVEFSEGFAKFFDDHPGFIRRLLVRGQEDRTHFMNLRFFDKVDSYLECTKREGYVAYTELMYQHMKPYDSYPREFVDVVLDTGPGASNDVDLSTLLS